MISQDAVTLLDINNTVPASIYDSEIKGKYDYTQKDTFMGFHCGNTTSGKLTSCTMKYQMIMARSLPEEVTQGTLEGDIIPGDVTFYRLQSTSDCKLRAYIAHGEVLPVATQSFGGIGIFAIPEMDVSTATYWWKRIIHITEPLLSDTTEKHYMKYSNISA